MAERRPMMDGEGRRWHPEMGGSLIVLPDDVYERIARDLNLCGCEWCEGHTRPDDLEAEEEDNGV
jgi:hypothetical protein